jgi:hypothetical protein
MNLRLLATISLAAISGWGQVPSGRWDGTIVFGTLKVPFRIHFEGSGTTVSGSFENGDARVHSTSGSFANGELRLSFEEISTRLEAFAVAGGDLKGTYGGPKLGTLPFTAAAYCTCGSEGEAGPEIMGTWTVPEAGWRLIIQRKGEDTLATLSRPEGSLGPLNGRFDGVSFMLHYFDGSRAALLEIEPRKDNGLDLIWKAPGEDAKKHTAVRAKDQQ